MRIYRPSGFVLAILSLASLSSPDDRFVRAGGPLLTTRTGRAFVWNVSRPIAYTPDQGPLGPLTNDQAVALTQEIFSIWASIPTTTIRFQPSGQLLTTDVTGSNVMSVLDDLVEDCRAGRGCVNPVIFDSDGSVTDALLGIGSRRRVAGFAGPRVLSSLRILQGTVTINGLFANQQDRLRGIMVHEVGHFAGLDHTQINLDAVFDGNPGNDDTVPTMIPVFTSSFRVETWATPKIDDIAAISSLYPTTSFARTTGTIRGRILYPDGVGFMGANVIARKVDDPQRIAVSSVSGFQHIGTISDKEWDLRYRGSDNPDLLGFYEIRGLPPGEYTVEIEELDGSFTGGSSVGPLDPPASLPGPPEFYSGDSESDDDPPQSKATVFVAAGAIVDNINIILNTRVSRPANDRCDQATIISGPSFTDRINVFEASTDKDDPRQSCAEDRLNSHSVWYRFTPPSNGTITVSTNGSSFGFDTVLTVYTGTCSMLREVACNDDDDVGTKSRVKMDVMAGTTYLIEVTKLGGPLTRIFDANLVLTFTFTTGATETESPQDAGATASTTASESAMSQFVSESEPNNSITQADPITPPVTVTATLDPAGDTDFFSFSGTQGQQATITLTAQSLSPGTGIDTVVTLFLSTGQQIGENDDAGPSTLDSRLVVTLPTTGRYVFRVRDFNGRGGRNFVYHAQVVLSGAQPPPPGNAEFEPNNTPPQANTISPDVTVRGILSPTGDVDFFTFSANAGQRLRIDVDAQTLTPPSAADTVIELFGSNGKKIAENDDEAPGQLDSLLEVTLTESGRFFFSIRDLNNKGGSAFTYQVTVRLTGGGPPGRHVESEPNNTIAQADGVVPDVTVAGTLDPGGDVDFFGFDVTSGQTITVEIRARSLTPASDADTVITLFDGRGNQLAENDDFGGSLDSRLDFSATTSGRVFLRVRNFGPKGGPTYTYEAVITRRGVIPPPQINTESEPNNSTAQANPITPPVTVRGTINPAGDVDFFVFDGRRGQQLLVDIDAQTLTPPSSLDSVVTLMDSRGNQLAENDDADGSLDSRLQVTLPSTGRYLIRIRHFDQKGGPAYTYNAVVTLTEPGGGRLPVTEQEPNNTIQQANTITPNVTISGSFGQFGDTDVFSFSGRAGQRVTIVTRADRLAPPSPADTVVSVLDAGGRQLATNNDDPRGGTRDSFLEATLPSTGTFFVSLRDVFNRGGKSFVYEMDVTLMGTAGTSVESEPNDTFASANDIDPETTISATINPAGDVDVFSFEAQAGQFITVDVDAQSLSPPSPAAIKIELFFLNVKLAESDGSFLSRDPLIVFIAPFGGRYFIRVTETEGLGGPSFDYQVSVRLP
ncbi:MAG TPA: DVUA0089 family protein [Blastocatellia bacterium]|nr:DVUA0089 family protein [Blastocatellia bacterium]